MESIVKKYQQKFRKVRDEMERWDQLQSQLISQFRNASSIIQRLQVIQDSKNYGSLNCVGGIQDVVLQNQMESLQTILLSMKNTMEDFHTVIMSLEKSSRDGKQLVKGGSSKPSMKQMQQRVGIKPCLTDCVDGLILLHDMHHSEYLLKLSLVSALSALTLKPSASDLGALQQLMVDQPNIPREEVQFIFDIIFAEEVVYMDTPFCAKINNDSVYVQLLLWPFIFSSQTNRDVSVSDCAHAIDLPEIAKMNPKGCVGNLESVTRMLEGICEVFD